MAVGLLRAEEGADYYSCMLLLGAHSLHSGAQRSRLLAHKRLATTGRVILTTLMFLTIAVSLGAQEESGGSSDGVFAPFVSRIRISTRDPEIRLTWQESEDVDGGYQIYRHTEEITASTFRAARLVGEVAPGTRSFIDTPGTPGDYYYAIVALSGAGEPYEIFIPYRNTTSVPVTVQNIATVEERSARITGIAASVESGSILVEYDSSQVGRELIVYRSTRPLASVDDLSSAGVVASVVSTVESVIDYPVPGVPYYYGVLDGALVAEGTAEFIPGANVTENPVEIPLRPVAATPAEQEPAEQEPPDAAVDEAAPGDTEAAVAPAPAPDAEPRETEESAPVSTGTFAPALARRRPLPLPFLQLDTDLETGDRLGDARIAVPSRRPLSPETDAALQAMIARLEPGEAPAAEPELLPEDQLPSPRGAEFTLRTILDGPFSALAWEDALLQLNNFLTLPLAADIRSRALFYRAQCYYFTGETRRAFVEFLLARNDHFAAVERWLDIILSASAGA